ncbi:DUF3055 family protein [Anaerobacillus sp. HL2]|nr:DUF3055 family protein [Anaerobacillus sp. HL2]
MSEHFYLYDEKNEETRTRFVSFMGESQRFDIAVETIARYYGNKLLWIANQLL